MMNSKEHSLAMVQIANKKIRNTNIAGSLILTAFLYAFIIGAIAESFLLCYLLVERIRALHAHLEIKNYFSSDLDY